MFSTLPRGSYINERISRNYGKEVLLGYWQDLRLGEARGNDCITPALKSVDACQRDVSEHKEKYLPIFDLEDADDTTRNYLGIRNEALHTYKRNVTPQFRQPWTDEIVNKFTTTYAIFFNLEPRLLNGSTKAGQERTDINNGDGCDDVDGAGEIKMDMPLNYGNGNNTGNRLQPPENMWENMVRRPKTTYAVKYGTNRL